MSGSYIVLAAAGWGMEDVLKIIVMVVFGLIYLFNHLLGGAKAQNRRSARPAEPRPAGRPEVPDEVAEFLKRATEKRSPAKRAEARLQTPRRPMPAENVAPRSEPPPSDLWPQSIHSQVDNPELMLRATQLSHVDQTQAAFQAHMQTFEHSVGRLQESASDAMPSATGADGQTQAATTPAGEVFSLLADPQNVRQAIILNEIIRRPEERW